MAQWKRMRTIILWSWDRNPVWASIFSVNVSYEPVNHSQCPTSFKFTSHDAIYTRLVLKQSVSEWWAGTDGSVQGQNWLPPKPKLASSDNLILSMMRCGGWLKSFQRSLIVHMSLVVWTKDQSSIVILVGLSQRLTKINKNYGVYKDVNPHQYAHWKDRTFGHEVISITLYHWAKCAMVEVLYSIPLYPRI